MLMLMLILTVLGVSGSNTQTFFIYTDSDLHEAPADRAGIPLTSLEDTLTVVAYAGAVWGEHDLSGREYCIAWLVRPADEFDEWLVEQGYQKKVDDDDNF